MEIMAAAQAIHLAVHALNDLAPMGLAAGLAIIVYQLVAKKGRFRSLTDNHLSELPDMAESLRVLVRQGEENASSLNTIRDGINYLRGRVNGRG